MFSDDGFFSKAMDWVVAALFGVVALLWGALNMRLNEVKKTADAAVPRTELEKMQLSARNDHGILRDDIKELFTRDDRLKDHINSKIDALRDDMHQQFLRLTDKINERK